MASLLKHFDDSVFVFRENFSEPIGALDKVVLDSASKTTVDKTLRVVNLSTERQHLASLLGNGNSVTSQHLDWNTEMRGFQDRLSSVLAWRVEHRQETKKDPVLIILLDCNTERAEATACKLLGLLFVQLTSLIGAVGQLEDGTWSSLGTSILVTVESAHRGNALRDGVEGGEALRLPALLQDLASTRVALQGENSDLVDRVEGLEVMR
jgi:hypothetical protein